MQSEHSTSVEELAGGFHAVRSGTRNMVIRTAHPSESVLDFARSTASGLALNPRRLECRFLYDAQGSALYEQITGQPEYYPTRTEAAILARHAGRIREITGPVSILELGSGSSAKTGHLLRSWTASARCPSEVCYIPVDVSESALVTANDSISRQYPGVRVIGIHSTYEEAFPLFADAAPAMVVFLGSTIGNLDEVEAERFFRAVSSHMAGGEYFLLGVDLEKDPKVLEAAYNDAAGVTAAFTRNLFARMNRELDSRLDLTAIEHVARWRPERRRIEIHGRFTRPQTLRIKPLARHFEIAAGEEILVEISRKFRLQALQAELASYGLATRETFTDEKGWFGLLLLQKTVRVSNNMQ